MRLFVSFSARKDGNCDEIANFLAKDGDKTVRFADLDVRACVNCDYECFEDLCKYRNDDAYELVGKMCHCQKIVLIVPMYCHHPASLYFTFCQRCQDYFMHNEEAYENFVKRLFVIGICGDAQNNPHFSACFEKWFEGTKYTNHVLIADRHKYGLKLKDSILQIDELKEQISEFANPTNAKIELSAMAVVVCKGQILSTCEMIYGRETLSLPKGHVEEGETVLETAIRECFEETNVVLSKDNFAKELSSFSYEFLTPSNKLIRKTIVPMLFDVDNTGDPLAKEARMLSVQWMDINEFCQNCSHENVKALVEEIL